MSNWKDEDIATSDYIKEYLQEFREGIYHNSACLLSETEKSKVQDSLKATEEFCLGLLSRKKVYMHDIILMAIGFYGGYLTALDGHPEIMQ